MNLYKIACFFLLLLLKASSLFAADPESQEFVRIYKKEFLGMGANTELQLDNQHGKVVVHTWDQNRTLISVRVTVRANNQGDAETMFERIKINFSNTNTWARTETRMEVKSRSWGGWDKGDPDFSIDYDVYMPANCKLNLANEYGNAEVDATLNTVVANVDYGNLYIKSAQGNLNASVDYGNITVDKSANSTINLDYGSLKYGTCSGKLNVQSDYSNLTFENANVLTINTDYSDVNIKKAVSANIQTAYGNYRLGTMGQVNFVGEYTELKIEQLDQSLIAESDYGNIHIDHVADGFTKIDITSMYADAIVIMHPDQGYKLNAQVAYGDINSRLPIGRTVNTGNTRRLVSSSGANAKGSIVVNMQYGSLNLD